MRVLKKRYNTIAKTIVLSVMVITALSGASAANATSGLGPVYRLYNNTAIQHLMTADSNESSTLVTNPKWTAETSTFQAYASTGGTCPSGTVPVYRIVEQRSGEHLLTSDTNEVNFWTVANKTWYSEGVGFCVYSTHVAGTSPVYRLYNRQNGEHLLTADTNEVNNLNGHYNWSLEVNGTNGVAFYANL